MLTVPLRELSLKTVVAPSLGLNNMRWDHPIQQNPVQVAQSNSTRFQPGTFHKHCVRGRGTETHSWPTSSSHISLKFPSMTTKKQELRLSEDFPSGMHPLLVHQNSDSVLMCQGIMPATEYPTSPAISEVWLTACPVLLFWEPWQEHTHTQFGRNRALCFA